MKNFLVVLLCSKLVVEIHCSFAPFEDLTEVKLRELKQKWKEAEYSNDKVTTKLAEVFDEGKGGEDKNNAAVGGEGKELKAVKDVVNSLRRIIPAVGNATKYRNERSEKYAEELLELLKGDASHEDVKKALGKAVIELHGKCDEIQREFLRHANKSGLFKVLQKALGPENDLNEAETTIKVLQEGHESDALDALEAIEKEQGKGYHALKSFLVVNRLFRSATCGKPTKGMIEVLGKRVHEEDSSDEPFPDLQYKILPFLGLTDGPNKPCRKRAGLIEKNDNTPDSLKKKMMTLVLQAKKKELCKDVPDVLHQLEIIKIAIGLTRKVHILMMLDFTKKMALVEQVKALMAHGRYEYAFKLVGAMTLEDLKKALLIELALKKLVKRQPLKLGKPSRPKELVSSPDVLLRDLNDDLDSRMK